MEKKQHTVIQNIYYYLEEVRKLDSKVIYRMFYYALIIVATSLIPAIIPSLILKLIIQNKDLLSIATQIILASLASGLFLYLNSRIQIIKSMGAIEVRISFFGFKMYKKFLTADYEAMTLSSNYNAYLQGLNNAVDSNSSGTEALYLQLIGMISSLLGIITFSLIMMTFSPLIVGLVFIGILVSIYIQNLPRIYRERNRDAWAKLDSMITRTKNEVIKPEIGKDIRVFNVAPIYMEKVEQSVKERMNYIKAESTRVLIADIVTLSTKLVRDGYTYIFLIKSVYVGMSLPQFTFLFNFMSVLDSWTKDLVEAVHKLRIASQDIDDMRHYLEMDLDPLLEGDTLNLDTIKIEFKNVYFKYITQDQWVLENINLVINPMEKMALVGINGAGKSTLVNLMMGLLKPSKGEILINGISIQNLSFDTKVKLFAPVFQDNEIWALTAIQNITLSKSDIVDRAVITNIIESLGLKEKFQSLPQGLDTHLTRNLQPDGIELSGGESQKLMLARALYKDAKVLILDEPTAALDAIAEQQLYEEYARFSKNKTSLFISHRLSSTRFCDTISVLDKGRIVESGTHESLMKLNKVYATMFKIQSRYYQKEQNHENLF